MALHAGTQAGPEIVGNSVEAALSTMRLRLPDPAFRAIIGLEEDTAESLFEGFEKDLEARMDAWPADPQKDEVYQRLREARQTSAKSLRDLLKFWFQHHVTSRRMADRPEVRKRLFELADLRRPFEWFPEVRRMRRKIHLHIGPTNSGKTYHALKRLEAAKTGIYAGPLRLLAHEVYQRLNAAGRPCILRTGDVRLDPPIQVAANVEPMISCTVEMTPRDQLFEVAVIDEIQMIADAERGAAWTAALLALQATEVHLCGEERSLELIKKIVGELGDELEVHRYQRLSPLEVQNKSFNGSWEDLQKGDCVVSFSVKMIHALRLFIERQTKKRVAIVYGGLPPETRAQQAALFNDPDNDYDILVASDAIGMGLNLNIKRIVFYATGKMSPTGFRTLESSMIKQIAGRAGRFAVAPSLPSPSSQAKSSTDAGIPPTPPSPAIPPKPSKTQSTGLVTAFSSKDLVVIKKAMGETVGQLREGKIVPTDEIFFRFASLLPPKTPFSYILLRFFTLSRVNPLFAMVLKQEAAEVADLIQPIPNLNFRDRLTISMAPVSPKEPKLHAVALALARCVAESQPCPILEMPELNIELLDRQELATVEYLQELEVLHKAITLYNWLSYRYEAVFHTRDAAAQLKLLVEKRIEQSLQELGVSFRKKLARDMKKKRRLEEAAERTRQAGSTLEPPPADLVMEIASPASSDTGHTSPELPPSSLPIFESPLESNTATNQT